MFRNEAPYLTEWIEFHRIVGFEKFYLYQNRSEDDWASVLDPYARSGIVELTDWPMPPPNQLQAYAHFLGRRPQEAEWVAFIDCDEFLFSPRCATIGEAICQGPFEKCGAIGVNWLCFGSSGKEEQAERPVIERFTIRAGSCFRPNCHIKSIVRLDRVLSTGDNPHYFPTIGGTLSETGESIVGPFYQFPSYQLLRINHYFTKSRQEYLTKNIRGRADLGKTPAFAEFQGADVDDRAIWRFLTELKERLRSPEALVR